MKLRTSTKWITVVFLALLLSGSGALYAQDRAGTSASPQLQVALGGQYLGGSGASSGVTGIESVLWNPAGLDRGDGQILVMASRREHLAGIGVNFLSAGVRFDKIGTIALHIRNFDIGDIQETDEFNMDGTGGTFSPTFVTVGATYSRSMSENISIGVTANLTHESFADMSATGVTFDGGVQYSSFLGVNGLNVGVSVLNIGTAMSYGGSGLLNTAQSGTSERPPTQFQVVPADADIPTSVDLSANYQVWRGLSVAATYSENTYKPSELQGQLSYNFQNLLIVRGAYSQITEDRGELESPFENRPSFGGTLNLEPALGVDISFDYAFISTKFFENNHILSLRGTF